MLALPALLGSECSLSLGSGALPVDEIVVVPSVVELIPGGLASVEAIGRDRLGGRVDVAVRWTSADTAVVTVTPRFATHTLIIGKTPGETRVVATHRSSGARDTVSVTVSAVAAVKAGPDPLPRHGTIEVRPVAGELRLESRYGLTVRQGARSRAPTRTGQPRTSARRCNPL